MARRNVQFAADKEKDEERERERERETVIQSSLFQPSATEGERKRIISV
jgi:hypothetical protein